MNPAGATDLSKQLKSLQNRLSNTEQQLKGQKRKFFESQGKGKGKHNKGNGKGKAARRGVPAALLGYNTRGPNNENICYDFNLGGCSIPNCPKGVHLCVKCGSSTHGLQDCKRS